jgi:hypothetical protein
MFRFLPLFIGIVITTFSCTKQTPVANKPEQPVTKSVSFEVYAARDYNNPFYDNALAEVKLSVAILNLKTNTTTVVWDTTFNFKQLKQYPQIAQKITIDKTLQHLPNSELLHVSKTVRYNVNGSMSMESSGEGVSSTSKLVTVSI